MLRVHTTDANALANGGAEPRRAQPVRGPGEAGATSGAAPVAGTKAAAASALPTSEQIKQAVQALNEVIKTRNPEIRFEIDDATAEVITRVVDKTTGEVIRQIPSEEMLRLAHAMNQRTGGVQLVRARA